MIPVLIWEPEALQAVYLQHLFKQAGFAPQTFELFKAFRQMAERCQHQPLVMILSQDSDQERSLRQCARLRSHFPLATLMVISHRQDQASSFAALQAGADDFLAKPLNAEELIVRTRAHLRRSQEILAAYLLAQPASPQVFGPLSLNPAARELEWAQGSLVLSELEFKLLHCLGTHAHRFLTREQLIQRLWATPQSPATRKIDNLILSLRKKLPATQARIESRYGEGYRLTWS